HAHGDDRSFRSERTSGERHGTVQREAQQTVRLSSRDSRSEDPTLREVPTKVKTDRKPQPACQGIRGAEQYTRSEGNRERAEEIGPGIEDVEQTKQERRDSQGYRGAQTLLEDTKQRASKHNLLTDRGGCGRSGRRQDAEASARAAETPARAGVNRD